MKVHCSAHFNLLLAASTILEVIMGQFLAIFHYLVVFFLFAFLLGEFLILRLGVTAQSLKLLRRIDFLYGFFAGLVIVSGLLRVFWGEIPSSFWFTNYLFWMKMALYVAMGVLSLPPTMDYLQWHRSFRKNGTLPSQTESRRTSIWLHAQLGIIGFIPVFAVLMKG